MWHLRNHSEWHTSIQLRENLNISLSKIENDRKCTTHYLHCSYCFFFVLILASLCLLLCRCVLLFRPPRLNSKFEDNMVKYTESISISSLRTFIRNNVYVSFMLEYSWGNWSNSCNPTYICNLIYCPYVPISVIFCYFPLLCFSFGLCPHLTTENRDILKGSDLLTAYYNVDYVRNIKGTNYWRNR